MASVLTEYQRFLEFLANKQSKEDVRRIANLVLQHLPHLSAVGAARRARSSRLAPIAVRYLAETPFDLPELRDIDVGTPTLGRLQELHVGPFRGFMSPEVFDLSRDITLVYGANGTGKSSFCEALEMALLGSITEAQVKRIDHPIYCNNARLRHHALPIITSVSGTEPVAPIHANEDAYRFCFIEKNRLDDFARIAARTPSDQRQLIATLFGVDQFAEFVRGFNPSLDGSLNLVGPKFTELEIKRRQLATALQTIEGNAASMEQLAVMEAALAAKIYPNYNYATACDWLLGTETQQGRLPYVQASLDAPPPVIYGTTTENLSFLLDEAYRVNGVFQGSVDELTRRSGEVSYKQLYEAVLQLADSSPGACPACGTGLVNVEQNPYVRANIGLEQLGELAELQRLSNEQKNELDEAMRRLHDAMTSALQAMSSLVPDLLLGAALPTLSLNYRGNWLQAWVDHDRQAWQALLTLGGEIERSDGQARILLEQRRALTDERQRLDGFHIEIERAKAHRAAIEKQFIAAKETVDRFDEANQGLIEGVEAEKLITQIHYRVDRAYDGFLFELKSYLDELPTQLLQGLGNSAKDLYNSFNRDDLPADLLHALWLPLAENEKIQLEFVGEPGIRYDALLILSEGHIKCLGLAILLAKNLAENCSVVIFDDVVNAIDDEHRNGIWRTFFENGLLDTKQVILTSHAEEFLHRIQQELGVERAQTIKLYKFLPHFGEHELRVDSNPPSKNYVLQAIQAFEADDKRDALRHARPAIESLTDRLWTWLGRRGDGRIDLRLAGPRSPWELNNKCNKLRSAFKRLPNQTEGVTQSILALDALLGVSGGSIEWSCLNGAIHDSQRDGEFDRATVRTIVDAITSLDQGIAELQR